MVATRGLEELTRKTPLLTLVDTAEEATAALQALHGQNFDDGLLELRWRASLSGTWQTRAKAVQTQLALRVPEIAQALQLAGAQAQGSRPAA